MNSDQRRDVSVEKHRSLTLPALMEAPKFITNLIQMRLTMHDLLAGYSVIIEIPVAWGEMDAFQHVNNIVYLRYAESARIVYLERAGLSDSLQTTGIGPILASLQCRYKFPLTYPDTARVGVRVSEVGADRFTVEFRIASARHQRVAAEGDSVIVSYDYRAGCKVPLPESWRVAIEAMEPAPESVLEED